MAERPVRSNLTVPITFKTGDVLLEGHSVNVSASGLLATFEQPVGIWITGEVSMVVGEYIVNIEARTARIQGNDIGLSFLIENENDRLAITIMNDYAMSLKQESH